MKWKTHIAKSSEKETIIRGHKLENLIKNATFTQSIFLVWTGKLPSKKEERMMDAILTSCIDHGIGPPSSVGARYIASGGNPLHIGVSAGILSFGTAHGGAIEYCAKILQKDSRSPKEIVQVYREKKKRLPGFGHKIYKIDPRTETLFQIAKDNDLFGPACKKALEIEAELENIMNRKLCLNVDGAIAAIMTELNFPYTIGKGFFILSRTAGLIAHVHEELTEEKPFRRVSPEDVEYLGPNRPE